MKKLYRALLRFVRSPRIFEDGEIVRSKRKEDGDAYGVINHYVVEKGTYYVEFNMGGGVGQYDYIDRRQLIKLSEEEKLAAKIMSE